jgi:hypothetical protein
MIICTRPRPSRKLKAGANNVLRTFCLCERARRVVRSEASEDKGCDKNAKPGLQMQKEGGHFWRNLCSEAINKKCVAHRFTTNAEYYTIAMTARTSKSPNSYSTLSCLVQKKRPEGLKMIHAPMPAKNLIMQWLC